MSANELSVATDDAEYFLPERPNKKGKIVWLTLEDLDMRTTSAKRAKQLIEELEQAQGGDLPLEQRLRIVDLAVLNAMTEDLAVRFFMGESVDRLLFATLCNAKRRALDAI